MIEIDNTSRIFFVDFENVKISGLDGLLELNSTDEVFIFYSDKADGITFDVHKNLNETKAKINLQKVEVGSKNALDFQLSSYLGFIIKERLKLFILVHIFLILSSCRYNIQLHNYYSFYRLLFL